MSVDLSVSDFSADFFTLDQENKPTDAAQFLKGLNALASRALDALSKPEDVELAFQRIKNANLIELSSEGKKNVDQRIQDVVNKWVRVSFGNHSRYVPRERLATQCGPKFHAQYTSGMKEARDQELDLQYSNAEEISADDCPEDCKELLLVYLQTGALPPGVLGDNALDMLVLAEQHQLEELTQKCIDFLVDNLSIENLDTFLEFTQQINFPQLELACLDFLRDNNDSISEELKAKYREELSIVEALTRGQITLKLSSSGKIVAQVKLYTDQTANVLQEIDKQFPIATLCLAKGDQATLFHCLEQIAPILEHLQELIIWNKTPTDNDLPRLRHLFPNLTALGNDAPFLNTFDEVNTYLENFRKPGEDDQESKKPLLRSLNLKNVPKLTSPQIDELTPYLQELYYLFIKSDKITSVVAPKATSVDCPGCTLLTTLKAPVATSVDCRDCTRLTTLEAPKATEVFCDGCKALTTLETPEATRVECSGCTKLRALETPEATDVCCNGCTKLTTLEAPEATKVHCDDCTALTSLETPKATSVSCSACTALTTLEVPKATKVKCRECIALTTLKAPKATRVYCSRSTALTTFETPEATLVECMSCTQLTTLEAPRATGVYCNGCTRLTFLEAPNAKRVYCSYCTALSTLKAPKATMVRSEGCTALATLEKPYCNLL